MKYFITIFFYLNVLASWGQQTIGSNVYPGQKPGILFQGEATAIKNVTFELIQVKSNKSFKKVFKSKEGVVFIKQGSALIKSDEWSKTLTPGGVAMITQGEKLRIKNNGKEPIEFYLFSYQAKSPMIQVDTCTSFTRAWEDLTFNKHERGGVRSYFSRPTSQTKRFEMHVTTLLGGLPSHPPHTHVAEEIILVMEGETEMEIGGKIFKGSAGDAYFIKSLELHGIKNTGKTSCSYYAFQWE